MLHEIALTMIPSVGPTLAKNLIAYCGSAEAVFNTPKAKLVKIPLIGNERARSILENKEVLKKAEVELAFIAKHKIEPLFFTDNRFPARLADCNDAPLLLYYKGTSDLNQSKVLGVVGTRNITDYGKEITKRIVHELQGTNILIVSGLAYGVDIQAHQVALENGIETVGVLGHGLNRIYPEQHRNTAKKMLEQGGLLTEYNSQDVFINKNFPQRNRIVAGMCDALLVVESATKGGALITANIANSYNREVFAVPGKSTDPFSQGCNFLIKTYKAQMVDSSKDILDLMLWQEGDRVPYKQTKLLTLSLTTDEQKIYTLLKENGELEIDRIVAMSGMMAGKIASLLLELEMNEVIIAMPGKRFKLA